jgi:hypothetical protein
MPEDLLNTDPAPAADPAPAPTDLAPATDPAAAADPAPAAEPQPETYEFTAPEGAQLDTTLLGVYGEAAKELGVSLETAQKLVDKMAPAMAARNIEAMEGQRAAWKQETLADPELGGEKFGENLAMAEKGLAFVENPKLRTLLRESGLSNHPEVIRAFHKVGLALSEDGKLVSGAPAGERKPLEKRLYDKSNMN